MKSRNSLFCDYTFFTNFSWKCNLPAHIWTKFQAFRKFVWRFYLQKCIFFICSETWKKLFKWLQQPQILVKSNDTGWESITECKFSTLTTIRLHLVLKMRMKVFVESHEIFCLFFEILLPSEFNFQTITKPPTWYCFDLLNFAQLCTLQLSVSSLLVIKRSQILYRNSFLKPDW